MHKCRKNRNEVPEANVETVLICTGMAQNIEAG